MTPEQKAVIEMPHISPPAVRRQLCKVLLQAKPGDFPPRIKCAAQVRLRLQDLHRRWTEEEIMAVAQIDKSRIETELRNLAEYLEH